MLLTFFFFFFTEFSKFYISLQQNTSVEADGGKSTQRAEITGLGA